MSQSVRLLLSVAVALLVLESTGVAQPSPQSMIERFDANRDGQIDGSEMGRMPGFFRETIQKASGGKSISTGKLAEMMPRIIEQARSSRGGDGRGGGMTISVNGGAFYSPSANKAQPKTSGSSDSKKMERREREPVNLELPADYLDGDFDFDGQIAFFEWMQWRRNELDGFLALDLNFDGFLTPKELVVPEEDPEESEFKRERVVIVRKGGNEKLSVSAEHPDARKAKEYFGRMDLNQNKRIDQDEWAQSRRIRPYFESRRIPVSLPMSETQFINGYIKVKQTET